MKSQLLRRKRRSTLAILPRWRGEILFRKQTEPTIQGKTHLVVKLIFANPEHKNEADSIKKFEKIERTKYFSIYEQTRLSTCGNIYISRPRAS